MNTTPEQPERAPISFAQELFRKGIHLSSFWMVALIWFYPRPRIELFYFFLTMLILNLLCEFAYSCSCPVIAPVYRALFGKMLRANVKPGTWVVSGSPPVFAAAALVSFCFLPKIAAIALGIMLLADTAAALVGRRFGKHKAPNGKSWEGTTAFCATGILFTWTMLYFGGMFCCAMLAGAAAGVVLASFAELFEKQLHLDDNLSIPLISGFVLSCTKSLFPD